MAMTNQLPPSFEDLEPEGEHLDGPDHATGADGSDNGSLDEYLTDSWGTYGSDPYAEAYPAFDERERLMDEAFEDPDEPLEDEPVPRAVQKLASVAARTAFEWGGQAQTDAWSEGNGRHPRARGLRGLPGQISSAAMDEAYELIEALAAAAVTTEDETEAAGLVAATVPVAVGLEPEAYRALWPAIPVLVRGAMGVTRLLHRRPPARSYIKLVPHILLETTEELAQHVLLGRPISKRMAAKTLARATGTTLSSWAVARRKTRRPRRSRPRDDD